MRAKISGTRDHASSARETLAQDKMTAMTAAKIVRGKVGGGNMAENLPGNFFSQSKNGVAAVSEFQERGIYAASTSLEICALKRAEARAPSQIGSRRRRIRVASRRNNC
jgi:hypothetical protein